MDTKPNFHDLGFSTPMGTKLRQLVEMQLIQDLKNYGINQTNLKFDWSESCIEGHDTDYLDGSLENYSGIALYDTEDKIVADGWMEFIHEGDFFICYWEFVKTFDNDKLVGQKNEPGIPDHIWRQLPDYLKTQYCFAVKPASSKMLS